MIGRGITRRAVAGLALLGTSAVPGVAQLPTPRLAPAPQPVSTGPTSYGWPGTYTPALGGDAPPSTVVNPGRPPGPPPGPVPNVVVPPQAGPVVAPFAGDPPPLLEANPSALSGRNCPPVADHFVTPNGLEPLPGSLEAEFNKELEGRRGFRACTWDNTRFTLFPNTLLWAPPYAAKRDPRLQVQLSTLDNYVEKYTLDNSIGATVGLARVEPKGADVKAQLDLFGVVHTRLSPNDLIATDYRFGFPVTFRRGDWQGKIGYEHTSAHVGDEYLRNTGQLPINYSKDEIVAALGRFVPDLDLRVYGQVSYAARQDLANSVSPWRLDAGVQWVSSAPTGFAGVPFAAFHVEARPENGFNPNVIAQVGWLFQNPYQRLGDIRIYGEYYNGRTQYGQFFYFHEHYFAICMANDF